MTGAVRVRDYDHERDEAAVLALLAASLGWADGDPFFTRLFRWKHRQGPWGPSPAWVATDGGTVVGYRAFMPWRFRTANGDVPAVRAVDTATAAGHRGRGIFTMLTMHGLAALEARGTQLVFNTPNDQSRPGYLKMGWQVVGRLQARMRPGRPTGVPRLLRARTDAELRSVPTAGALAASAALEDCTPPAPPPSSVLKTDRTPAYLQWRYGGQLLHYRAVVGDQGVAFFRLRRRGGALEAVLGDVLAPRRQVRRRLVREVARRSGADYLLALGSARDAPSTAAVPRTGPTLTWRPLCRTVPPTFALSMGDVELF